MAYNYTVCNRDQLYLLAPSMKHWLAEDHFVWFLLDAIEQMDLSAFHAAHRPDGKGREGHILNCELFAVGSGRRSRLPRRAFKRVAIKALLENA